MKAGDLVRVKPTNLYNAACWPESLGKLGLIVETTNRLHIPAANVLVLNEIAEFDLDELELVNESR